MLLGIGKLEIILDTINRLQGYIKINKAYINILVKIIGITYVTEFRRPYAGLGYQAIGSRLN